MQLVLKFRNMLPTVVREELDSLVAIISAFWAVEHNADGTHGNITADSLTINGVPVVPGGGGGTASLPTTTKGDLIAHNGVTNVRVPVGSIGRVLQADPSAAPGVSWQIPASPGTGNVVGPASAITDHLATYSDTTGKVIKDSGVAISNVPLLDAARNTFTGEMEIAGPAAGDNATRLTLTDTTQPSGAEDWQFVNINQFFALRAFDNSPGNIQQEFRFDRTGVLLIPYLTAGGLTSTPLNPASLTGPVPITKGGTGQAAKTPAFDALSPLTTKGDLIAYDGADNVRVPVSAAGQILQPSAVAAQGVAWTPNLALTGTVIERGRTVPMGEWINIPYSAGLFTASGSMLWNVTVAPATLAYMLIGRTAFVFFNINGSITGTASTDLFLTLPFNPTISTPSVVRIIGATATILLAYFVVGSSKLGFQVFAGGNHALTASANVQGMAVCQV